MVVLLINQRGSRKQQNGSKYFACTIPNPIYSGFGVKRSNLSFSQHGHVAMQQHGIKYFARSPLTISSTLGERSISLNSTFQNMVMSWSCCISNKMESQMQQHGIKIKFLLVQNMVMLYIKLKKIRNAEQNGRKYFASRIPLNAPNPLGVGSKGRNSTFSKHGHVVYQIKWNHACSNMAASILPAYCILLHPPQPKGWGQKVKIQLFQTI